MNSEIYNSLKSVSIPSEGAPPETTVYVQFKGEATPADVFGGTWTNISNQHAGRFFRAEGGSAASFGSQQAGGLPNITGTLIRDDGYGFIRSTASGAFAKGGSLQRGIASSDVTAYEQLTFDASRSSSLYGAATEVRPINETFRIWKRIG